jgi:catechol 2,3-dioxygenase-like lactoylglutathione lyase family enzyme
MNQFLWPATLHHLRRDSPEPERLARFYGALLGDPVERIGPALWHVHGPARRMLVGEGEAAAVPYFALSVPDADRLARFRQELEQAGVATSGVASPLLGPGAFKVTDPDGRSVVFDSPGVKVSQQQSNPVARLQHFVCATSRLSAMLQFYRDQLGLVESDRVLDPATPGDELSAVFLRSDEEHHSFAAFRAPLSRADHHSYETAGWMDIRDWADRMGSLRIPLWWGPGRHGVGNNLFFMIEDPDGHKVEFSAEIERMPREMAWRSWPHEQRTLNLWGSAWMRS